MAVTANSNLVYREEKGPLGNEVYNLTPQEVDGNFKFLEQQLAPQPFTELEATTWDLTADGTNKTDALIGNTVINLTNRPVNFKGLQYLITGNSDFTLSIAGTDLTSRINPSGETMVAGIYIDNLNEWRFYTDYSAVTTTNPDTKPASPDIIADDTADTLQATHALGFSEILVKTGAGEFVQYDGGVITVGNISRAYGYYQFKIKASGNRPESDVANSPAFNVAGLSVIYQNDFEGTVPPNLPTNWAAHNAATNANNPGSYISGVVTLDFVSDGGLSEAFYDVAMPSPNYQVEFKFRQQVADGNIGLVIRNTTNSFVAAGSSYYYASAQILNPNVEGIALRKRINLGTPIDLGGYTGVLALDTIYRMILRASGSNLTLKLQNYISGQWLNSAGVWQTGETHVHDVTDSEITGAGKVGIFYAGSVAATVRTDDFLIYAL